MQRSRLIIHGAQEAERGREGRESVGTDVPFKVEFPTFPKLGPNTCSFHHLPIVHSTMNASTDQPIEEIRALWLQSFQKALHLNTDALGIRFFPHEPLGGILYPTHITNQGEDIRGRCWLGGEWWSSLTRFIPCQQPDHRLMSCTKVKIYKLFSSTVFHLLFLDHS